MTTPHGFLALPHSERRPRHGARLAGLADQNEVLSVSVRVRRRTDAPALPDPIQLAATPIGKRRYLSREEFATTFGAAQADLDAVTAFARHHDLTVREVSVARRTVVLAGTVAQISAAFSVRLGRYESPTETYRGREGAIYVPAELTNVIEGVFGLDNRRMARRAKAVAEAPAAARPAVGAAPAQTAVALTPPQVANLYNFPAANAAGYGIGLIEFGGGYVTSDIDAFFNGLNLPDPTLIPVGVDGATNSPGSAADVEVALDIDVAGTIAPGATIVVFFAPWTEQGWVDVLSTAVHDTANPVSAISISWGWPELETIDGLTWSQAAINAVDEVFQEAAALGISVFVASGDHGSDCGLGDGNVHVLYPGSDPYVTSCGGTIIQNVNGNSFNEDTWQDNNGWATGGGISSVFALPSWQQSANIPPSLGSGNVGRGIPDVAGNADSASGYNLIVGGQPTGPVGGTSAVAPLYAGLAARISAFLGGPVGYLNPVLYSGPGVAAIRDINDGISNANGGAPGYVSGPGWDACTGLGVINGSALLSVLAPAPAGSWHVDNLTAQTGAALAVGNPRAYMFPAQGTQHAVYSGADGHIHELYWNGQWNTNDLTVATNAPLSAGDPSGYMFNAQGTQHVVFLATDGHVHELWWNGGWNINDLTAATSAPPAAGNPHGYMFDAQGTQHVVYRGTDGHIHELYWNGQWNLNDLTAAANAPLAAGDPFGYVFDAQGTQHVIYLGTDGHIHELWWNGGWNVNDLSAATNAPPPAGNPTGYVFNAQGTQHVNYRGTDGDIHELWWNGGWNANDLTAATSSITAAGDPHGYMFDAQQTQHVIYRGVDGDIHELYWNGAWYTNDLTADTGATAAASDPAGYVFVAQGTQHAIYRGTDNNIYELWWG